VECARATRRRREMNPGRLTKLMLVLCLARPCSPCKANGLVAHSHCQFPSRTCCRAGRRGADNVVRPQGRRRHGGERRSEIPVLSVLRITWAIPTRRTTASDRSGCIPIPSLRFGQSSRALSLLLSFHVEEPRSRYGCRSAAGSGESTQGYMAKSDRGGAAGSDL